MAETTPNWEDTIDLHAASSNYPCVTIKAGQSVMLMWNFAPFASEIVQRGFASGMR